MNHHECLYQTRLLMSEIETSVSNLTEYFADRESMPSLFYDGTADAAVMLERFEDLKSCLRQAYNSIADEWNNIISNDVRRHEVGKFIKSYRRLRMYCREFRRVASEQSEKYLWIFTGDPTTDVYANLFDEMDDDMSIILGYYDSDSFEKQQNRHTLDGIAKRMRRYVEGVDDEFYERLIFSNKLPVHRIRWQGKRNEASLFAIHFGLNDYQMNAAFFFKCHTQTYRPLKISSDKPTNAYDTYDIYNILKDYSPALKK